jgi:hypothetical protein
MRSFALEQPPRIGTDLLGAGFFGGTRPKDDNLIYVGSGKAAISLILAYLKSIGVLPNKMTPVLVPQWLGTWVYAQMLSHAFPTTNAGEPAAVALCYHQYGFPQDMDRVLDIAASRRIILIEDCAHAAATTYKGHALGTMGEFGLFSLSKFAFCFALGAIATKYSEFSNFVSERQRSSSRSLQLFINGFKFIDEYNNGLNRPRAVRFFDGVRNMAYARYGDQLRPGRVARGLWWRKRDAELSARRENFRHLRSLVDRFGICDHLEESGVAPYAVPLAIKGDRAARVVNELTSRGIKAGTYRFDVARCVFEPKFQPCVLIPIHSGMSGTGMNLVTESIMKCL